MAFATDLGRITPTVKRFITRAKYLVLESNYDADMLRNGKYSYFLKRRILGENGHLCNAVTANFLAENFCNCCYKKIFLCHISNENNTPEIALSTTIDALTKAGIKVGEDVDIYALKRDKASDLFILD
jgi:phosphoribosyl 1,2-cyclic phosphodiesterase